MRLTRAIGAVVASGVLCLAYVGGTAGTAQALPKEEGCLEIYVDMQMDYGAAHNAEIAGRFDDMRFWDSMLFLDSDRWVNNGCSGSGPILTV